MAVYINLTGAPLNLVDDDWNEIARFPPSPVHKPAISWLDDTSAHEGTAHKVIVTDGLSVEAKFRTTGLDFEPEAGVTYIVSRETALVLHGLDKTLHDVVYPDGWVYVDVHGDLCCTTFVRLIH